MPRDLFGDVTNPSVRVGGRKWYTVPLSLVVHTLVIFTIVVIPLFATGTLPLPRSATIFVPVDPAPLPVPPAVRPAAERQPSVSTNVIPIEAPDSIQPELEPLGGIEDSVGSVPGIIPGGITDGTGIVEPPPPPPPAPQKPVRVGGEIRTPTKIHDAPPVYPQSALLARIEGVVILEAIIGIDGRVRDVRVLRGRVPLDQAALAAVRQWMYTPTLLNGVPVPVIMTVTVNFHLH
jgi:periplasmic protein TonB